MGVMVLQFLLLFHGYHVLVLFNLSLEQLLELILIHGTLPAFQQNDLENRVVEETLRLGPDSVEHPLVLVLFYEVPHALL